MTNLLIASIDMLPQIGGISTATHHLANAFAGLNLNVTVLGPDGAYIPQDWTANYSLVADTEAKPKLREGPVWRNEELPRTTSFIRSLWQEREIDRAIAMHPFYFGLPLAAVGREVAAPVSVMFHGFELRSQLHLQARLRAWRMRRSEHGPSLSDEAIRLARTADEILTNSNFTANIVRRTGRKTPAHVIGCGLDLAETRAQIDLAPEDALKLREEVRLSLGFSHSDFVIGTLGRLVSTKNVESILKAAVHIPQAKVLVLGDGPERGNLEALSSELGLAGRIVFQGNVTEDEKWPLLRTLDAFCLMSKLGRQGHVEGFGIVMLEAAAAGVPVIAASTGGMPEVIRDGKTGLIVHPTHTRQLVEALQNIRMDPSAGRERTHALRTDILDRFNWNAIADHLVSHWTDTPHKTLY